MDLPETCASNDRPRVLLVEDDEGVRRSLHLVLRGRGYEVRSYAAAATLLADPEIHEASGLVADYRLPDSDGIDVRQGLKDAGWQGRSVLITAYPSARLREAALASGYDAVLEKPVRQHDLIGALEGVD